MMPDGKKLLRPRQVSASSLKVSHVTSGYEKGPDIVNDVSFELRPGKFVCILGENGCGKTTLLRTLLALIPARNGNVTVGSTDLLALSEPKRAKYLAYIPQAHRTPFPFKVSDIVRMGRTPYLGRLAGETKEDREIALLCLEQMQIEDLSEWPYTKLSGGQQQLVLIARALAQQASFLIMDEPTSHLDYGNQFRVLEKIGQLREYGLGILMVTHNPAHCFYVSDEVMLMLRGKMIASASPAEVMTSRRLSDLYRFPICVRQFETSDRIPRHACIPGVADPCDTSPKTTPRSPCIPDAADP